MSSEDGPPVDWARLEFLEDGTPFAARYDDVYCSRSGRGQASEVFVAATAWWSAASPHAASRSGDRAGARLNLVATLGALGDAGRGAPATALRGHRLHPVHPEDLERVHRGISVARPFLDAYQLWSATAKRRS